MSFADHFVIRLPTSLPQDGVGSADFGGSAALSFAPVEPERPALFARWTATSRTLAGISASRFFLFFWGRKTADTVYVPYPPFKRN